MENVVYTCPEVASLRQIAMREDCPLSYGQLYRMIKAGELEGCYFMIGKKIMVNWNKLIDFLNGKRG